MSRFAFLGVGGYIAPRHLQAIADTGGRLIVATDAHDSVGILDRHFSDVLFFRDYDKFCAHVSGLRAGEQIDYVTICSPNDLHKQHIRFALENGADAICEKPLVLTTKDLDELVALEKETGKRIYTILQLRVHEAIAALRKNVLSSDKSDYEVDLNYITSRGPWYRESWKGSVEKSGGLATNIGIHFFDMLTWIFGGVEENELHIQTEKVAAGYLKLERARVRWVLSIDKAHLPPDAVRAGKSTFRSITVNGKEIEFSSGFTDLHTKVYQNILAGKGHGPEDARNAIAIVEKLRNATAEDGGGNRHPALKGIQANG